MGISKPKQAMIPPKPTAPAGIPHVRDLKRTDNPDTITRIRESDDGIGIGTAIAIGLMLSD